MGCLKRKGPAWGKGGESLFVDGQRVFQPWRGWKCKGQGEKLICGSSAGVWHCWGGAGITQRGMGKDSSNKIVIALGLIARHHSFQKDSLKCVLLEDVGIATNRQWEIEARGGKGNGVFQCSAPGFEYLRKYPKRDFNHVLHPSKPKGLHPRAIQQEGETLLQPSPELTAHKYRKFWLRRHSEEKPGLSHPTPHLAA